MSTPLTEKPLIHLHEPVQHLKVFIPDTHKICVVTKRIAAAAAADLAGMSVLLLAELHPTIG